MRVVVREYAGIDDDPTSTAGHLVAEFADRATARRAYEVAQAWRGTCEDELREYDRVDVNPFEPVPLTGAQGGWYLLVYGPAEGGSPDEGFFDAQGLVLSGKSVACCRCGFSARTTTTRAAGSRWWRQCARRPPSSAEVCQGRQENCSLPR